MSVPEQSIDGQRYRPDIDGLRAVAVLAVVFFHVGFTPFSGGFVGVDVFFVISGFLITRLIHAQVQAGTFSFARFYVRRARRLFPALFFTIVVSFLCAAWLFSPADLERFARSVVFTLLSLSNFLFWRESGYFDASASVKPLLHTWSLSVEEQFYLVWPAALVALMWAASRLSASGQRFAGNRVVPVFLIAAGLLSLALTQFWLKHYSAAAAFYLPPFRVVEFAIGGLMVWLVSGRPQSGNFRELLVVVGLALIAWPVFAYSEDTVFPGLAAMPPCLGTAMLIYAGTAPRMGRLLNNRVAVGIGLISYSLYLVHWPMIVFYEYWVLRPLQLADQILIVAASIALATAMYFVVEMPFRRAASKPGAWSPARFGLICVVLAALVMVPAASAWSTAGWPARLPPEIRASVADLRAKRNATWKTVRPLTRKKRFKKNRTSILVIGDSHGKDMSNALLVVNEKLGGPLDLAFRGIVTHCQPFIGERPVGKNLNELAIESCNEDMRELIRSDLVRDADFIFFSVRWGDLGASKIAGTIDAIRGYSDAEIVVFARTVEFDDVPTLLSKYQSFDGFERFATTHRVDNSALNALLRQVAEGRGARFISKEPLICPDPDRCDMIGEDGELLFYDYGHWTLAGARRFGERMLELGTLDFLFADKAPAAESSDR